ncbi:DUF2157 domain-containing protein [Anaerobacillus sp. MEB173]|uniref:DUF2157 domain-containing protein n=1 Tax=Anaerobacillus sp. MEB173 TaxID=3383345 RepID=UPI003F91FD3A
MKKRITLFQYEFLKKELIYLEEQGKLLPEQANELMECYELESKNTKAKGNIHFVQLLSIIGSVLIGLGILSFVASNWSGLSDMTKFLVLLSGLIVTYCLAWVFEERKPIFSKSLYYIGGFAYGAEIFYIGQLFHLGGSLENALLAWALGVLPLAYYLKDKWIYIFSIILIYLFIELKFMIIEGEPSYWMVVVIPMLFAVWYYFLKKSTVMLFVNFVLLYQFIEMKFGFHYVEVGEYPIIFTILLPILFVIGHKIMNKSAPLFIVNMLLFYQWIGITLHYLHVERVVIYVLPFFIIGLWLWHKPLRDYQEVAKLLGFLTHFVAGLLLTMEWVWMAGIGMNPNSTAFPYWIIVGVAYMIYGLWLSYKGELIGIFLVSVLIFRFYVDLSLVFMSKSIAFFIGGILLLVLGYWFEKTRRGEKNHDKKTTN